MPVITGSDGSIEFDLGDGSRCTANVFSWEVNLGRETLDTTRQGDEARRRTGGLADHTGSVSLRLQFSDDVTTANSAWQILDHALGGADDELKADLKLYLQREAPTAQCDDAFSTLVSDPITLAGTVVIAGISLDCTDPGEPIVAVLGWEADGALVLARDAIGPRLGRPQAASGGNGPATGTAECSRVGAAFSGA